MNTKLQEMWDSAHEIPYGTFVPEGTLLVRLDPPDRLYHYEMSSSAYWRTISDSSPVRTVEPLPDPADTGTLAVHSDDGVIVLVDTYDDRCYDLSRSQAMNLARTLTEAINGH